MRESVCVGALLLYEEQRDPLLKHVSELWDVLK